MHAKSELIDNRNMMIVMIVLTSKIITEIMAMSLEEIKSKRHKWKRKTSNFL